MLLRESSRLIDVNLDLRAVTDDTIVCGLDNEDVLRRFADAAVGVSGETLGQARAALLERMGPGALVEAAAICAMFSLLDRLANGIGIPLEPHVVRSTDDFREPLGLVRFNSARNTPLQAA
jgi:hypothetical protein